MYQVIVFGWVRLRGFNDTSHTDEVSIGHNEQEDNRKPVAGASSAPATAPAAAGGAAGASVAFCLRRPSFQSLYSLCLCNLIRGYNFARL